MAKEGTPLCSVVAYKFPFLDTFFVLHQLRQYQLHLANPLQQVWQRCRVTHHRMRALTHGRLMSKCQLILDLSLSSEGECGHLPENWAGGW